MKLKCTITLMILLNWFSGSQNSAQEAWKTDPPGLKHWMTAEELERKDEIGKGFLSTGLPEQPVTAISEFARMKGVLIRYPFGISYALISEMAADAKVITIVSNQSQENTVRSNFIQHGVNLNNCEFIHAPTNSYWTRDYGPWFIAEGEERISIVNFPYNRPRPNDDQIPMHAANYLGLEVHHMNIIHTGGNYMNDGMGVAASTDLVWSENPTLTPQQITDTMQSFTGSTTYHVVPDPNNTYIDHIDCWAKFLDVDKILIREVPSSHPQYNQIEAAAAYWEQQTSSYGAPYQVFRVFTPTNQPYTNSLILNNKVFVPITGSSWDNAALAVYEQAMPGYTVKGFTGSWQSTDALHCRTKEIPDPGMLHIRHMPLWGNHPERDQYKISATIIPYSNQPLIADSLRILYSADGIIYHDAPLSSSDGKLFDGFIPAMTVGSEVRYYIAAADQSGRNETHPFIGEPDPHQFVVAQTHRQQVALNENWTAISTHLIPFDEIGLIFEHLLDQLIMVKKGDQVWWPEMNINTLGNWEPGDCLLIKLTQPDTLEIVAIEQAPSEISLQAGWNMLPMLSEHEVDVASLFDGFTEKVIIVKEPAGLDVYWPEMMVNTIGMLKPGKGYMVKLSEAITVTF